MSISENYRQLLKDVGLDDDFIKYLGDKYLFSYIGDTYRNSW